MGIERGAVAYMRGQVKGDIPPHKNMVERMRERAFRDLDPRSEEESSAGFVDFFDPMDTRLNNLVEGRYGIRIDTLKVPGSTLKMHADEVARTRALELGKPKLTRKEIEQVRYEVKKALRLRTLPKTTHVQMVIENGHMRLFSTSSSVWGTVLELLDKTLAVSLQTRAVSPFSLALEQVGEGPLVNLEAARWHLAA